MDYAVVPIEIEDRELANKVCGLLSDTFGREMTPEYLDICTNTDSNAKSVYIAAIQDGAVIGFNAFIAHDLITGNRTHTAFQSCWTATSRHHRGKRIFQNLINEGKNFLKQQGAAFIFGFPNENSQPIFTQKLGFKEIPSLKWQVPNIPVIRRFFVSPSAPDELGKDQLRLMQNDRQLVAMKSRRYGELLVSLESEEGTVWGVRRRRKKAGIPLNYCEIGGVTLNERGNGRRLLEAFFRKAGRSAYFQLTTTVGNSLNCTFRRLAPAQTNDLIVFDLNMDTSSNTHFDFFGGVKDVF